MRHDATIPEARRYYAALIARRRWWRYPDVYYWLRIMFRENEELERRHYG